MNSRRQAIAGDLNWPLIQIDPSHFLEGGLDGIYLQANTIFKDLMDLSGVVVLFDEMDALVQTRDSALKLDTAAQFLTTYMLPKLTELHDLGRVVFLMATNYQERFDAAIKRAGRFDLLLCMGPPTLRGKLASLHRFLGWNKDSEEAKRAADRIQELIRDKPKIAVQLELYSYGEFKSFVKALEKKPDGIISWLRQTSPDAFEADVERDAKYVGLRTSDLEPLRQLKVPNLDKWKSIEDLDALAFTRKDVVDAKQEMTAIIRYLLDRRESKRQA